MTSDPVCADCGGPVRYHVLTNAYYHVLPPGNEQLETIANNIKFPGEKS